MTALPEPGTLLAEKYVVEGQLGSGAVGVVYSATHTELRQRVAIKLLREAAAPIAAERMIREARAAVTLQSEHVVRVMDVGRDAGRVFIVMEQLEGSDLRSLQHARGRFPIAEAVDYLLHACAGIAEAHARGVVHRDLKPSNLFLTHRADGGPLVKVLDFGISKSTADEDEEASLTGPAEVLGSPMYMSPEQVRGSRAVDHRTDIWSLGVILYRFLSGRAPFGSPGTGVSAALASVVTDEPPTLAELVTDVPEELDAVVMRCLRKSPAERFASVAELASRLAPFGTDDGRAAVVRLVRGASSRPPSSPSAPDRMVRPRSRRAALLGAIAIAVIVVPAAALAVLGRSHGRVPPAAPEPPASAPLVSASAPETASLEPDAASAAPSSASDVAPSASIGTIKRPPKAHPVPRPVRPASSVVRSAATDDRY
jgi:serine/threonine-protein kinase